MIDIIIPAYNAHNYIERTLESINKQTIKDKFLITIIDDGSIYSYQDIISKYKDELNINLVRLKKNKGAAKAKQKGIDITNNPFLLFMDADDTLVSETAIESLYNKIINTNYKMIVGKESNNKKNYYHEAHMVGKLIKRDVITKYNIKVPNLKIEEDVGFILSLYSLLDKDEILCIDKVVYRYLHNNKNSITSMYNHKNGYTYKELFKAINYAYKYVKKYKRYEYFKKRILYIFLSISQIYITRFKNVEVYIREEYLKNCYKFYKKYYIYLKNIEELGKNIFEPVEYNMVIYFVNEIKKFYTLNK